MPTDSRTGHLGPGLNQPEIGAVLDAHGVRPTWPEPGEVHMWETDLSSGDWDGREAVLSHYERQKASEYRFERDAMRFARARIFRRSVLGAYLGIDPKSLDYLESGDFQRPALAPQTLSGRYLDFNASRSGDRAVLAIASTSTVGIDAEVARLFPDADQVSDRFFHLSEARAIQFLQTPRLKQDAFFRCWTRKEALVKGMGVGLQAPLDQFVVGTALEDSSFQPRFEPEWQGSIEWWIVDLSLKDVQAALAVSTPPRILRYGRWQIE